MKYTETVTRLVQVEREESIECPPKLVKLVNSNDREFGRNGFHYMGCQRGRRAPTIDRIRAYIDHHKTYHEHYGHPCNCPVKVS